MHNITSIAIHNLIMGMADQQAMAVKCNKFLQVAHHYGSSDTIMEPLNVCLNKNLSVHQSSPSIVYVQPLVCTIMSKCAVSNVIKLKMHLM